MTDERKDDQKATGQKAKRGFAAMGAESQREIAAQGGRAAHRLGKAHRFDSREGREAAAKRHAARHAEQAAAAGGESQHMNATTGEADVDSDDKT